MVFGGRERLGVAQPVRSMDFKGRDLVAGENGKRGKQEKEYSVTRQAIQSCRIAVSGPLHLWRGLRCPVDVVCCH